MIVSFNQCIKYTEFLSDTNETHSENDLVMQEKTHKDTEIAKFLFHICKL